MENNKMEIQISIKNLNYFQYIHSKNCRNRFLFLKFQQTEQKCFISKYNLLLEELCKIKSNKL